MRLHKFKLIINQEITCFHYSQKVTKHLPDDQGPWIEHTAFFFMVVIPRTLCRTDRGLKKKKKRKKKNQATAYGTCDCFSVRWKVKTTYLNKLHDSRKKSTKRASLITFLKSWTTWAHFLTLPLHPKKILIKITLLRPLSEILLKLSLGSLEECRGAPFWKHIYSWQLLSKR